MTTAAPSGPFGTLTSGGSSTAASGGKGLFGAPATGGGLFGQPATGSGGLFGQQPSAAPNLFPSSSTGLFGGGQIPTGSLFSQTPSGGFLGQQPSMSSPLALTYNTTALLRCDTGN